MVSDHNSYSDSLQKMSELLASATDKISAKNYKGALADLEKIPAAAKSPLALSAHALCQAEVEGNYKTAVNNCHDAIKKEPKNPEHYYRQGRILLLAGRKKDAIWVMRMGLRHGRHKGILDALAYFGIRRTPLLTFLPRSNPLNKYLGMFLSKLNLR